MSADLEDVIKEGASAMESSVDHLKKELVKLRTGKASASMLSGIEVDYYGTLTPLNQVANVSVTDSKTLSIQPWEKSMLGPIEKAIFEANLGLTPMNDGELVRISIPPLTEERRKDLFKHVKSLGEDAKISLRNTRQKLMDAVRSEVKAGFPEDAGKRLEGQIQGMVNTFSEKVDEVIDAKEKDIMTV
ncbi:MAG: ribosome recycling factor [Saprospirales bacterium]|nr:MAG: ribosome recycling factor [Saprospirales bacterium]